MLLAILFTTIAALVYFVPAAAVYHLFAVMFRFLRRLRLQGRARPALEDAAKKLALRKTKSSLLFGDELRGAIDGLMVTLDQHASPRKSTLGRKSTRGNLRITITTPTELPHRLAFASRDGAPLDPPPFADALRTFDSAFDDSFITFGRGAGVSARLDATIRKRLLELDLKVELRAQGDTITALTRQPVFSTPAILRLVELVSALARDLTAEGPDIPALLLANAVSDPEVAVRYQNLDLLLRDYPSTPQAKDAMRIAWEAPERGIRFLAAVRMGYQGLDFLEETVAIADESIVLKTMALRHLGRHGPRDRVLPVLRAQLLAQGKLRDTAIELLGRLQDRDSVPRLLMIGVRSSTAPETKLAIAQALGNIGDDSAESFLLSLLGGTDLELMIAAAGALGKAGTSLSMAPLGKIANRYSGIRDLAQAANTALSRIEMRLGPAERGQLSLTELSSAEGALSMPLADRGAMSLAAKTSDQSEPADRD